MVTRPKFNDPWEIVQQTHGKPTHGSLQHTSPCWSGGLSHTLALSSLSPLSPVSSIFQMPLMNRLTQWTQAHWGQVWRLEDGPDDNRLLASGHSQSVG